MVRSMRFSPPISLTQPSTQSVAQPVLPVSGVDSSLRKTTSEAYAQSALGSPVDPSEHVAALVHEAVCKRTVLPVTYSIPENIGDRISRLSDPKPTPKPVAPVIILPKIPQPETNGRAAHAIEPQPIKPEEKKLGEDSPIEASAPPPVVEPPTAAETPLESTVALVPQSAQIAQIPDTSVAAEIAESAQIEQIPDHEAVAIVAEPTATEEIPDEPSDNSIPAEVAPEPVAVAEAKSEIISNTDSPVAEAEDTQASTLLNNTSSELEAVSTALKSPDADQKDTEPEVESSSSVTSSAETTEPSIAEALADEAQTSPEPSLAERSSAVVEVVTPPSVSPDVDKKNSEAAVEPTPKTGEKTLDSKTVEITCPECQSSDIRKNGRRHGKQRYICKDCGRQFVNSDAPTLEDKLEVGASPKKAPKAKNSQVGAGESTSKSSKARSKKKAKPKGFGGS